MRASIVIVTLSLSCLPAGASAAAEPGLFGYFRTICAPGFDPAAATARARAAGFALAKKQPKAGDLDDGAAFEKAVGDREFFAFTGRKAEKAKDDLPATSTVLCGVGVKGKDAEGLAAGRNWVGVPAGKSILGVTLHPFRQGAGGRTPLSFEDKAAMKAAVLAGDLNVMVASGAGGAAMLLLTKTKAAP